MNANIARLASDMHQANSAVSGFARQTETAIARVKSAFATLGVGIGFATIIAGLKNIVNAAASLDDVAERTGAAVEQLSQLAQVAKIGGHSMEIAETALIRLSKALHGGDEEAKGAGKALAALGLSADALRNKDTAEALRIVAGELNKYADGSGKTALALDLLGKSGAQALPFLKDLATEQGIATRVTAEQAAAAEELQKQIKRLENDMQAASQAIALKAVPALSDWVAANREALRIGGSTTEMLRLFIFNLDALTSEKPREEIDRLTASLTRFQRAGAIGKFIQSPTGAIFGGREDDLKKQIEFLKFLERQQALAGAASLGGDTPGERARMGGGKLALNYAGGTPAAAAAAVESPFMKMMNALLEEELKLKGELTTVDKLALDIGKMKLAEFEKLSIAEQVELEYLAHSIDLRKQEQAINKAALDFATAQVAEDEKHNAVIRDFNQAQSEAIKNLEFETKLLGIEAPLATAGLLSKVDEIKLISQVNLQRETAVGLRKIELDLEKALIALGPDTNENYEAAAKTLRDLAAAQKAALPDVLATKEAARLSNDLRRNEVEEWKSLWSTIESTGKDVFVHVFSDGKGAFEGIGKAIKASVIDLLYQLTAKQWLISIQASVAGALGVGSTAASAAGAAGSGGIGGLGNILGLGNSVANIAGGSGSGLFGSLATSSIGQSLGLSSIVPDAAASAIGLGALEGVGTTTALTGAGAALGTAIPYVGLAIAAASMLGLFGKKGTAAVGTGHNVSGAFSGDSGLDLTIQGLTNVGPESPTHQDASKYYDVYTRPLLAAIADIDRIAKTMGIDTSGLGSITGSFRLGTAMGQNDATTAPLIVRQVTNSILDQLVPGLKEQALANEDLADTFARLGNAATQAEDAWKAMAATLIEEARKIRGLITAESPTNALAQFAIATAQARAGDMGAANLLPELSQAVLANSLKTARNALELQRARSQIALSLETTASLVTVVAPVVVDPQAAAAAALARAAAQSGAATTAAAVLGGFGPGGTLTFEEFDRIYGGSDHASGLPFVPRDNYMANLHQGETVVDASSSSALRRYFGGSGGDNSELLAEIRKQNALLERLLQTSTATAADTRKTADTVQAVARGDLSFATEPA